MTSIEKNKESLLDKSEVAIDDTKEHASAGTQRAVSAIDLVDSISRDAFRRHIDDNRPWSGRSGNSDESKL